MSSASPPNPNVAFLDGQQSAWRARLPSSGWAEVAQTLGLDEHVTGFVLEGRGDADAIAARLVKPTGPAIGLWRKQPWLDLVLGLGPGPVARLLRLRGDSLRATPEALSGFVAVFELEAVDALVCLPDALVDDALPALMPLGDLRLVDLVTRRWTQLGVTSARGRAAAAWLNAHPTHAAWGLVVSAREMTTGRARAARIALCALAGGPLDAPIQEAARHLDVDLASLVAEEEVPVQLPAFWKPERARALVAATGGDLPAGYTEALAALLVKSGARATELGAVRGRCTEESLRQFALDVFHAFMHKTGAKTVVLWPAALIAFGGDPAVVELARALRDDRFVHPPVAGSACDVLASIGSPLSIAALVVVAGATRALDCWSELEPTASARLDAVAAERGLTRAELEDRTVAALDGSVETHAELVAAAQSAWLERALRERRRFARAALLGWVDAHPSFGHMARQLVWGTCGDDDVISSPAVVEGSELCSLLGASSITVGPHLRLVHPLDLDSDERARCQEAARARGLRPTISQLERESFVLTADEASSDALTRFAGRKLGLGRRLPLGWRRGPAQNAIVSRLERPYPGGIIAALHHSDIDLGDAPPRTVTLRALTFERDGRTTTSLGEIDPVMMSETIRDLELLLAPRRPR